MTLSNRLSRMILTGLALSPLFLGAVPASAQELVCPAGDCTVERREGWIEGPDGPVFANYEVVDGMPVVEGDIVVQPLERVGRAALGAGWVQTWPGGVIPYAVATVANLQALTDAVAHVNANTVLTLVPRTSEANYVEFDDGDGCFSNLGMVGGRQQISPCDMGAAVHEILHAAGVWHEQSRTDRDQYITVHYENITPEWTSQFDTFGEDSGVNHGPYDFGSIMHYEKWAFSANGEDTISPVTPGITLGQRNGLSEGDIAGIASLYAAPPIVLENGISVPVSGATDEEARFTFEVPADAQGLAFELSGGTGDGDLYVAFDREPTLEDYDCRPYSQGSEEACTPTAEIGTWHVMVLGFSEYESTLVARYEMPVSVVLAPLTAAKFKLKQDVDASRNRLILKVIDSAAIPAVIGASDDPTIHGARIRVVNPATGETGSVELPAGFWSRTRNGKLRYSDGLCRVAVKPGKLKVRCTASVNGFTLDEATQGQLGLVVELGSGGFCAGNGGSVVRDSGVGFLSLTRGVFASVGAPRPVCDF